MYLKSFIFFTIAVLVSTDWIPGPEERIVGGHYIPIEYVPWQVALLNKTNHHCGGIIYSDRAILTAAHCLLDGNVGKLLVRAGSSHWSKGGQVVKVLKAIPHPKYDKYTTSYDVAVLILESPLKFGPNVRKITLAEESPEAETMSLVSGWGFTRVNSNFSWPILQGVHVAVLDPTECKKDHGEDVICADAYRRDVCRGDSGSPLVRIHDLKLIGIASKSSCGHTDFAIYADAAFFSNWFHDTIKKHIC